jgi:hypothetical protein
MKFSFAVFVGILPNTYFAMSLMRQRQWLRSPDSEKTRF